MPETKALACIESDQSCGWAELEENAQEMATAFLTCPECQEPLVDGVVQAQDPSELDTEQIAEQVQKNRASEHEETPVSVDVLDGNELHEFDNVADAISTQDGEVEVTHYHPHEGETTVEFEDARIVAVVDKS